MNTRRYICMINDLDASMRGKLTIEKNLMNLFQSIFLKAILKKEEKRKLSNSIRIERSEGMSDILR